MRPGTEALRLADQLPISDTLRNDVLAWARDWHLDSWGKVEIPVDRVDEFDERGYTLSRALQTELGELYAVTFHVTYEVPHGEVLRERAVNDPLPGWDMR